MSIINQNIDNTKIYNSDNNIYISDNIYFEIISNRELEIIYTKINSLINTYFPKLILPHKKILVKYLYKLIVIFGYYYYSENFIKQLYLNNYQDIFSLFVLLMPFYDLNKSKEIMTLDELFLNQNDKAKMLESSYYIDHLELSLNIESYLEKYFVSSLLCINNTLAQTHCLLLPNWCNIFPYTMETYKTSDIYKNFEYLYLNKKFSNTSTIFELIKTDKHTDYDFQRETNFKLGFPILYGTIYSFLYMDIKKIKWMIYDLNIDNEKIIPNIIYLANKLEIKNIVGKPWDKMTTDEQNKITSKWNDFIESPNINQISLKSLVLFYLRWEKDNNTINQIDISDKCLKLIDINTIYDENYNNENINDEDVEFNLYSNDNLEVCLKKIYKNLQFEKIYKYIYDCIHKFRYTWYGYCCLDDNKNILSEDNFYEKYFLNNSVQYYKQGFEELKKKFYITPKNIYNFCKSIIHFKNNGVYEPLSPEPIWNNMTLITQNIFISRLNNNIPGYKIESWFNITNNLKRSFPTYNPTQIENIMFRYRTLITTRTLFINVVLQTLVYNGMLSYYKFNPKMTDSSIIPNKNTQYKDWESYIFANIDIKSYSKSYHAFSNTMIEAHGDKITQTIIDSKWYTNFGANWIAQIQVYHHYNSNRVMFITGATGAGKSTVTPFLLVYAVKIINFNNNAKVVCTQPRTQPVKDNSEQISKSIGLPILIKKNNELDNLSEDYKKTTIGEGIKQDINYIQYKHAKGDLTDDLYHPYLRLYTDGSLYNIIKQSYIFKKSIITTSKEKNDIFLQTNIFDVILVDEAHEHNTYMDMILTLSKFATYINNQVTLGIISATMDNDELIYRRYFQPIDDNWKYPICSYYYETFKDDIEIQKIFILNKNFIDRRIHLSIPFGGMNFDVKEYPNNSSSYPESAGTFTNMKIINEKVLEITKYILNNTSKGDILIFQPGEADIKKLLVEINKNTPPNILAIPFYSKLDTEILENVVKKIAKEEVRKSKLRYPKNKYDITDIFKIPSNELLPEGTYNRFIVIATNIAEASITIDTLEFVIDTGNQKISVFDADTNQDNLEIREIAVPNQKQRKGRVGRVKPGSVYYTYDRTKLGEKVVYKMNIQNINSFILDLITSSETKLIDPNSDPYKADSKEKLPKFLQEQYSYLTFDVSDNKIKLKLFDNKQDGFNKSITSISNIIYPYSDGKYELETLEDNVGKFFIVHPGEDYFIRNPKTLEIIETLPNYSNKVTKAFNYGKALGMISDSNLLTPYGILINSMVDFLEISDNPVDFTRVILDCFSFNVEFNSDVFKNILLYVVFKTTTLNFKISNYLVGKADFLIYSSMIADEFYNGIDFEKDILINLDPELKNLKELVTRNVNDLVDSKLYGKIINVAGTSSKNTSNIEEIKKVLVSYYSIKYKLEIIILSSKFVFKNNFNDLIKNLLGQKDKKNLSNEYLFFIDKFILYYTNTDKYLKINVIYKLIAEFRNNLSEINISKKMAENTIERINEIIKNSSIFENEFLKKIKIIDKKSYPSELINNFNQLSGYDKICFLIIKNFPQNILVKISETEFYIEYYKKDVNKIYGIEKNEIKINNKKTITFLSTKVPADIRNYYIFAIDIDDYLEIKYLMVLTENIINFLNNYFKSIGLNLFSTNTSFNDELSREKYQSKYFNIIKKIDKIIKYIRNY
jgi:hypothetical protein